MGKNSGRQPTGYNWGGDMIKYYVGEAQANRPRYVKRTQDTSSKLLDCYRLGAESAEQENTDTPSFAPPLSS